MNGSLELLRRWFVANKLTLSLNVQKTNYILFHRLQWRVNFEGKLSFSSLKIDRVTEFRFLGVMIDDCLLWRPHINSIVTKMAKFISIFYKIRNSANRYSLILLYYSLIYPHLTYCNTVWCTGARTPLDSIHKIQKKIVRIITFSNRRQHSVPLLKSCNMLKILDIKRYMTSTSPVISIVDC